MMRAHVQMYIHTLLCRLCGRLDGLISEPTRAVGATRRPVATVTAGTAILISLPRMAQHLTFLDSLNCDSTQIPNLVT